MIRHRHEHLTRPVLNAQRDVARPDTLSKQIYFENNIAKGDLSYMGKTAISCHLFKKKKGTIFFTFSLLS